MRVESYRGFVFGSLNPDVKPLAEHLGEAKVIIDQIVDQAPEGLEVLTGNSSYTFNGNWKMQMENGCDGYHVSSVHENYQSTMNRRAEGGTKAVDANGWSKAPASGVYGFEHGHMLLWTQVLNPEVRPIWNQKADLEARLTGRRSLRKRSRQFALRAARPLRSSVISKPMPGQRRPWRLRLKRSAGSTCWSTMLAARSGCGPLPHSSRSRSTLKSAAR